ncbi:MAG: haloacid dehalogenase type II [Isosphaeraceae bacterium]
MITGGIKALTFDVFGTVVDLRGTIVAEGSRIGALRGIVADWNSIANAYSQAYGEALGLINSKKSPWSSQEMLLRQAFDEIMVRFGLSGLSPSDRDDLGSIWARLKPWSDSVSGFKRLHGRFALVALSNANKTLLASLGRWTCLPWDRLLSAELAGVSKPDPRVYRMALAELSKPAESVLMVASHAFDLNAAHAEGFKTALVQRTSEPDSSPSGLNHKAFHVVDDLEELAEKLVGSHDPGS